MNKNKFSKNQVRKLGALIRSNGKEIDKDLLDKLQKYRKSYHSIANVIFTKLREQSENIDGIKVSSYRIKRIESIISKLSRYPKMKLDTMWDICGCRCVVSNERSLIELRNLLAKELFIKKEMDYITVAKPDGYKGIHLYVTESIDSNEVVEIQLRTEKHHNWATFVEIIDLTYDLKIKEGEKHPDFNRLHKLMSIDLENLETNQKSEILDIESTHKIFNRLSKIFNKNYIKVRQQWLEAEEKTENKFYIFSVGSDLIPNIESFTEYKKAENRYYELFSTKRQNVLLAHLDTPTYSQVKIAYSNYILTMHQFFKDWISIAFSHIPELSEKNNFVECKKLLNAFRINISLHHSNISEEIKHLKKYELEKKYPSAKIEEWIFDLEALTEWYTQLTEKINKFTMLLMNKE